LIGDQLSADGDLNRFFSKGQVAPGGKSVLIIGLRVSHAGNYIPGIRLIGRMRDFGPRMRNFVPRMRNFEVDRGLLDRIGLMLQIILRLLHVKLIGFGERSIFLDFVSYFMLIFNRKNELFIFYQYGNYQGRVS